MSDFVSPRQSIFVSSRILLARHPLIAYFTITFLGTWLVDLGWDCWGITYRSRLMRFCLFCLLLPGQRSALSWLPEQLGVSQLLENSFADMVNGGSTFAGIYLH